MRAWLVRIAEADEDAAATALWEAGTAGVELRPPRAGLVELVAYFPLGLVPDPEPALRRALPEAVVEPVPVPAVDWVARFREGFRAFTAGGFTIAPAWAPPAPAARVLLVDPGRAFGTGTHETTRLCLAAIEELATRRRLGRTLDLGSGTALLAIAAARLGAGPVVASDIDPEATASSRAHAERNRARVALVRGDGGTPFRPGAFDLVVANLTAPLLVQRAAEVRRLLAPGGTLVLSGLLVSDLAEVRAAYAGALAAGEQRDGEWAALVYEALP